MTSSSAAPADGAPDHREATPPPMFYVVSKRKLALLYLGTFTLYTFYWFYKHWDLYKGRHPAASRFGTTVWPVQRAIFPMFFTHALFFKVRAAGRGMPAVDRWHAGWHATLAVAWMLLAEVLDRFFEGWLADVVSIACVFPLLFLLLHAQGKINLACGDPAGASNDRLTRANKAWIALGAVAWAVSIAGLFVPDEEEEETAAPCEQAAPGGKDGQAAPAEPGQDAGRSAAPPLC